MTREATPEGAVATLRRVAFLLEREGASRYRSRAFRVAAAAVESAEAWDVVRATRTGTLTELPGVGDRTAEVVAQVLAGEPVPYLDELERAAVRPGLDPVARVLHDAQRGDLHAHTEASDGTTSIQEMLLAAVELGHDWLAITDHSPHLRVADGLSAARLTAQVASIAALNRAVAPFRVLTGIEVDILDDGTLDQDPELLDRLDVVVASLHSDLRAGRATLTRRMLRAVADPRTDVLGHCTGRQLAGPRRRPPSAFDARAVFESCAEHGVAVEINCQPNRQDPPDDLLALAVELGCLVAIDTDAHAPGELDRQDDGAVRAAAAGLGADRVVTTWPADEVVARSHRR